MSKEVVIKCPGCGSEITADGKKLLKRSAAIEELEDFRASVPQLVLEVERLEKELKKPEVPKGANADVGIRKETDTGGPANSAKREWGW
jgi:hypothetical protein